MNNLFNVYFRELLSQQQHYDWGLRALKTVLKSCGDQLHLAKHNSKSGTGNYLMEGINKLLFTYFIFDINVHIILFLESKIAF